MIMRVLGFIWRGVIAFDRVGRRIPQLVQQVLLEMFFALPLAFFIAKIVDIRGAFGVPGAGGSVPGVFWGALVVSLICGFFLTRQLVKPRVEKGTWTPPVAVGDFTVVGATPSSWQVSYIYLTSHPSYGLLGLFYAPIPLAMALATINEGDSTFYWRVFGIAGLIIVALIAIARVLAWYVFKFGRDKLDVAVSDAGLSVARLGWEIAWKPVLMLTVVCYAAVLVPIGVMFWIENREIAALPVVTVADADHPGEYFRVEGAADAGPVYWAPKGTGRGGNNYAGAGVLVDLPSGGEALVLAESMAVANFRGMMTDTVADGHLQTPARVVDEITDVQREYYGFDLADFPPPPPEGRVLLHLSRP